MTSHLISDKDFQLTCETFAQDIVAPNFVQYDRSNSFPESIHAKAQELNLVNICIPQELGGQGYKWKRLEIAGHAISKYCPATAFSMGFNHGSLRPLIIAGTNEQKEEFIKNLITENKYCSICLTEENVSGSSLFEIETTATQTDKGWVINGHKCMVGNGNKSEQFIVLAKTIINGESRGLSLFVVPKDDNVEVSSNTDKLGFRAVTTPSVTFNNVEVPNLNLIGQAGQGAMLLLETLQFFRLGGAIVILGMIDGALQDVIPWIESRKVFGGQRLIDKSHIRLQLGEFYAQYKVLKNMLNSTIEMIERGEQIGDNTAVLKLLCSELSIKVMDSIQQIYGWRGIDNDYAIQKRFRDSRQTSIFEGTNDIQRLAIFNQLLQNVSK